MRKIADISAYLFILSMIILSGVSILGVWEFFQKDVISKSFQTIGLLAVVAIILIIADHFMEKKTIPQPSGEIQASELGSLTTIKVFKNMRVFTLSILIIAVAILTLLGILAIWEVVSGSVLHKSLASIAIIAFSSLVIVMTCLEREKNPILHEKKFSNGMVLLIIITATVLFPFVFSQF